MCGFIGFTGATDSEKLEKMTNEIFHRGPDDSAYIVNSNFSVGYRRLAIIDLTDNIYPIENEKKNIELVLNGEIYNYKDLREELKIAGHKFVTDSDSETIVHGYEEWGLEVIEKLRGMFTFVLYDKEKNVLFIGRDRLGIKPLYYAKHDGRLVFGSEIKGLLKGFDIDTTQNNKAIYRFLNHRIHDIDDETFFKNIYRLLPGHFMLVQPDGSFDIKKYWDPSFNPEFKSRKSDEAYAEEFKEIFSKAVDLHLIGDVPVGVTLSGGLDSSGITSLAKTLYDKNYPDADQEIIAFSAVHPGEKIDESEYIDTVVKATGIKSVKIVPQVDTFWEDFEKWNYFQEEPVISGAPYAYYTVMREATKDVTVLLSGQGGDELLAGYIPYFMTYLQTAWDQKKFWPMLRETWMGKDLYFKFMMQKLGATRSKDNLILPKSSMRSDFVDEFRSLDSEMVYSRNLNERLYTDVTSLTTPALLRYEDKNSMANSLESRVPFFDHKVVEYIFNLPVDQKIKFGWNRYIYRQAMKGIIPEKNRLRRSKVGFTNPEWEWIERKSDKFMEIFSSESFKNREFWNYEQVLKDFQDALDKKLDGDILYFWRLFSVEMWLRAYVD